MLDGQDLRTFPVETTSTKTSTTPTTAAATKKQNKKKNQDCTFFTLITFRMDLRITIKFWGRFSNSLQLQANYRHKFSTSHFNLKWFKGSFQPVISPYERDPPYERDCYLGGIPRIPNHRAPNHQFTISWFLKTNQETLAPLKAVIIPSKPTNIYIYPFSKKVDPSSNWNSI